jgi:hypothetical protein
MRLDKLGAFFPLRKIHLQDPFRNTMLLPLTSPNLDTIEIRTKTAPLELTEVVLASFLQSVAQSPFLRSLAIMGTFTDITLQVLPDFVNLHRLSMRLEHCDIPVRLLKRLASSMPSLRHLNIHITNCRFPQSDSPQRQAGQAHSLFRSSFPSLETLYVGCNAIHLENLFGVLDAPLLKSVSLGFLQSSAHTHQFVERNQQALRDKVHSIIIKTVDPSLSIVKPFEDLRDLIVASLFGPISMVDIVDTFTYDGSWSRSLVHLQLMQMNPTNPLDCMSIAALCFIADACPNLKFLEISIHRPDKPEKHLVVKKDGQEHNPHHLKKLVFLNLPGVWDDSTSLAIGLVSLLYHLFPSIAVPNYAGGKIDKPDERAARRAWWKGVQDMWKMYQRIKDT